MSTHDQPILDTDGRSPSRAIALLASGLVALTLVGGLAGCYERVVSARGLGADQYSVSESYQESDSTVDSWIFGDSQPNKQNQGSLLDRR